MSPLRLIVGGVVLVAVTATVTSRVVSQNQAARPERAVRSSEPSEHHAVLEKLAGRWHHVVTVRDSPRTEPGTVELNADYRWMYGGRFLIGRHDGYMNGEPFQATEVLGYDNYRGRYNSFWIDNKTTAFTMANGRYDAARGTLIFEGVQDFPQRDLKDQKFTMVYAFTGDDQVTIQINRPGPDGAMFTAVEVKGTREE